VLADCLQDVIDVVEPLLEGDKEWIYLS
jgi:hypothetical protein